MGFDGGEKASLSHELLDGLQAKLAADGLRQEFVATSLEGQLAVTVEGIGRQGDDGQLGVGRLDLLCGFQSCIIAIQTETGDFPLLLNELCMLLTKSCAQGSDDITNSILGRQYDVHLAFSNPNLFK